MPTRSYYFPTDFIHLEEILRASEAKVTEEEIEYFREKGIPPISRPNQLPLFLGISPNIIYSIRRRPHRHYRRFYIRKKDGTKRQIDTPRTYLKVIQWWILDNVLNRIQVDECVFGFVVGRNAIHNAEFHLGANHLLNVDVRDFFPTITVDKVIGAYLRIGFSAEVSKLLSEICCLDGCVPQGAPTSPALANLVAINLDVKLKKLATDFGTQYSRYADDIVFSSRTFISEEFLNKVEAFVRSEGFELNDLKTRFSGRGDRMEVTGVVINEKLQPSRRWRKNVRARIFNLSKMKRATRNDLYFLQGIRGIANQFPASGSMGNLARAAESAHGSLRQTVIGYGEQPILPNMLTVLEAKTIIMLGRNRSNAELAYMFGVTQEAIKSRLKRAYKKIGVNSRYEAFRWAKVNL